LVGARVGEWAEWVGLAEGKGIERGADAGTGLPPLPPAESSTPQPDRYLPTRQSDSHFTHALFVTFSQVRGGHFALQPFGSNPPELCHTAPVAMAFVHGWQLPGLNSPQSARNVPTGQISLAQLEHTLSLI
jgi:hypothetical protein